ncbi:hypothetical protein SAY86_023765 [Trapa natans]|uniref:Uncharacterized protein n=1 Tax=Trapa natans TaxID=22666 RepID=A0AAN7MB87_TRANT|nr:hypothetical protein SAY86_023765 [Trapa natans]
MQVRFHMHLYTQTPWRHIHCSKEVISGTIVIVITLGSGHRQETNRSSELPHAWRNW